MTNDDELIKIEDEGKSMYIEIYEENKKNSINVKDNILNDQTVP